MRSYDTNKLLTDEQHKLHNLMLGKKSWLKEMKRQNCGFMSVSFEATQMLRVPKSEKPKMKMLNPIRDNVDADKMHQSIAYIQFQFESQKEMESFVKQ